MTSAMHDARDDSLDKIDSVEAALLGLTEAVAENRQMPLAIIEHLQAPYEKPPAGIETD